MTGPLFCAPKMSTYSSCKPKSCIAWHCSFEISNNKSSMEASRLLPGRCTEELITGLEEKDEDPCDEFWFERELLVNVPAWRPLFNLLLHANFAFDEGVRVARLQYETL